MACAKKKKNQNSRLGLLERFPVTSCCPPALQLLWQRPSICIYASIFLHYCVFIVLLCSQFVVQAHGVCDCPGYPGQSAQSDGHVGEQHDVSDNI